ncbi:MAG: FAD:protein FMN transferase [Oceanospirillaceae bacterium]|nr:FAD:protein FMN transferase [Oceanospirillaceae bacterium]
MSLLSAEFKAFGTRCEVRFMPSKRYSSIVIFEELVSECQRIERKYSKFISNSLVSQINHAAGTKETFRLDDETALLIDFALSAYQESDGLFDITFGSDKSITRTKQDMAISFKDLYWNKPYLKLPIKGMKIDFGGFGKEYAIDRVYKLVKSLGVESGLINFGGDIGIIGSSYSGDPWKVGIKDPDKENLVLHNIYVNNGFLATSGTYERVIMIDNQPFSHIINPECRTPILNQVGITCYDEMTCLSAGFHSTTAILKGDDSERWLKNRNIKSFILSGGNVRIV